MTYPANTINTNNSELTVNAFHFAIGADALTSGLTQNHGGMVTSVVGTDNTGVFTVTLAKPWPVNMLACVCSLASVAATDVLGHLVYKKDSYVPTTGVFTLQYRKASAADATAAGVGADVTTAAEAHVIYAVTHNYAAAGDA